MMKKTQLYLLAIIMIALLSTLSVIGFLMSSNSDEKIPDGISAYNVSATAPTAKSIFAPDTEKDDLIFLSKRGYINESGYPTIIGEVKNGGNVSMKDILITASFYCSKGKLIGAKEDISAISSSYTEIVILAPGETSPFKIVLSVEELSKLKDFDIDDIEKFQVSSKYNNTSEQLNKSFESVQSHGEFDNETEQYTVIGTVKNIGNETVEQIKVIGTFYDNQSSIIDVMHTSLQDPLITGKEAQFEMTAPDKTIARQIETYHIQVVRT